jgi:hypothetical protein
MRGAMRFSRSSALPEKMIWMHRISVPTPHLQRSCHGRAGHRMGKLPQRDREPIAIAGDQRQQQSPSSENNYRQAFAKA